MSVKNEKYLKIFPDKYFFWYCVFTPIVAALLFFGFLLSLDDTFPITFKIFLAFASWVWIFVNTVGTYRGKR